jgi:lipopolysaccharide/colanic/teichoic acid biosynthesis glycosyltransferase
MENSIHEVDFAPASTGSVIAVESPTVCYPGGGSRVAILPPQHFMMMLCLERERCERSDKRLGLVLLESPDLARSDNKSAIERILVSLSLVTRDTDIIGWYREGSIVGILLTETGRLDRSSANGFLGVVDGALRGVFGVQQAREMRLSLHFFPDDCPGNDPWRNAISMLYPDLQDALDAKRWSLLAKRFIDIAGSCFLLMLLLPLLFLIALSIRLTSSGPIVFRQRRLGQFGEEFTFLKFRSMYTNADNAIHKAYVKRFISNQTDSEDGLSDQKVYKLKKDPRITPVGAVLRRTSLDELPQLFNVLTGRMSLVGPRPPLPYEFESYEVWHRLRLMAKPGITGFWQVEGRSRVKFDDMVRMDLEYSTTWSLWLDIKILLRTPHAVLNGNGAF